jgi:chorismate synthase
MSGNTFGLLFTVTSFGESHGPAIGCVVDGCPPGMALDAAWIQAELDRRKPGTSRHVTQRREPDEVEILSGVFEGKTTGTPIALLIRNTDQRSKDYGNIADTFRPGHADYTYWHKYGIRDPRGGGRSSARETAVRVAAGAIAKKWLAEQFGIVIRGHMTQIGEKIIPFTSWDEVNSNPFFAADASVVPELEAYMDSIRKSLDSIGARLRVVAENVPVGWGEPVFDRLDADIAHAMMSISSTTAGSPAALPCWRVRPASGWMPSTATATPRAAPPAISTRWWIGAPTPWRITTRTPNGCAPRLAARFPALSAI